MVLQGETTFSVSVAAFASFLAVRTAVWSFAVLLPRNPFQIQSGVTAVAPLVALKDCNL